MVKRKVIGPPKEKADILTKGKEEHLGVAGENKTISIKKEIAKFLGDRQNKGSEGGTGIDQDIGKTCGEVRKLF